MELKLRVDSLNDTAEAQPVSIEALKTWLSATRFIDIEELEGMVGKFHHIECSNRQRLELLDWLRPLLTNTAYAIRAAIADGQLPLPEHVLQDLDGLQRIHAIVADLYKVTILDLAQRLLEAGEDTSQQRQQRQDDLVLACYGAINFLAEQLRTSYEGYRPAPKGGWQDIHHIYSYARYLFDVSRKKHLDGEKMRDEFFLIEHVYKRSLLLGLCNPYHFPVSAFGVLNRTLNRWAHSCRLHHVSPPSGQDCLFSVDLYSDYPAAPVLPHSAVRPVSERYLVLDTRDVVSALNQEIELTARQIFDQSPADRPRDALLQLEMLRRLAMNWGRHPIRRDSRKERQGKCEIVAGFMTVVAEIDQLLLGREKAADKNRCCHIVDVSEMGYQVEFEPSCSIRFRVGELLALRDADNPDSWSLAVVRWARYTEDKHIRVGMFIMGRQVKQRVLSLAGDNMAQKALSMAGTTNFAGQKNVLLAPSGFYLPGRQFSLHQAPLGSGKPTKAGSLIMSGVDFDVFDYR